MANYRRGFQHAGRTGAVLAVSATLIAGLGMSAQADVLEEIRVTAQKREQDIQDVGIAINAFTGDQMRTLGVQQSIDIATFAPGIHISGNIAGQNTQFSIRGVTQNDFNDIIEAPNAVYLDEGYIAIAQAQTFAVFDIERVEMLKGPQGTLFGRNATGGMVQYISRKPSFEVWEGFADVTYGLYDTDADPNSLRFEGAVGGPISDTVAVRGSLLWNDQDPYLENFYNDGADVFGAGTLAGDNSLAANSPGPGSGADLGDDETLGLRGILQFEPSEDLRFMFMANYSDTEFATGPYQSKPTTAVYNGSNPDPNVILSQGELVNVIDTPRDDSRRSICADGSDCGSDQDNNGFPDDFDGDGAVDIFRVNNQFQITEGTDFFGYRDPNGDEWTFSGDYAFANSGSTETLGLHARVEYDFGNDVTLTSITDYKDYEKLVFIDVDSAPVNQLVNYAAVDADSFTQEIRLNADWDQTRWVVGLFYLNIDSDSDNGLKAPINSVVPPAVPGFGLDIGVDAMLETDSYSLFGQIERDLAEDWTLIVGGRVILEEKDVVVTQNLYNNDDATKIHQPLLPEFGFPVTIGPVCDATGCQSFTDDTDETYWSGKVQLDWRATEDSLWYLGVNRGVKAGSYNAPLAGGLPIPPSILPYDEEILTTIEGGFKYTLFDGTTRLNGSVYYYDYKDYQAFLFTGVGGVVINADAENYGVELELQTSPVEGLDILLSGAWFDATVEDVPFRAPVFDADGNPVGTPIVADSDPVYAPELQIAGLVRYQWPLFGGFASIQGDFSYSDDYFYNLRNFDADQYDSYTLVNAIIGWTTAEENWAFNFSARNLTDEKAGIQGFDLGTLCGCNEISFRAPRWYGLNVKYQF
jgi:iron complex outermembrane receptor protein